MITSFRSALLGVVLGVLLLNRAQAAGTVTVCDEIHLVAALAGGGFVTMACDGTITLSSTLSIANSTTIDAPGHAVTFSGGNAVTLFSIPANKALTLTNLTVANGLGLTAGGFYNLGILTLVNCTVSSNTAWSSGQVCGGILNRGTLVANGCTFVGNVASTNADFGAEASAIAVDSMAITSGSMSLLNCTFSGNVIGTNPSPTTISQVGGNASWIINCTVMGRVGFNSGFEGETASLTLKNTIAQSVNGVTDGGSNLISSDPGLGPLANNGGPTLTMALLPDSPAIDNANSAVSPMVDQRGFARPYGAGYDIGAFETVFIGTNPGVLRLTAATYSVVQTNGSAIITVNRDNGAAGTVSVQFATSDGTAVASQDYSATNGTFTFNAGEISKSFVVQLATNPPALSSKTVNLTLSSPTGGATLVFPSQSILTILPVVRTLTSADEAALRAAVSSGGAVILSFDGALTLTSPLVVSNNLSLDGSGHNVTLSGGSAVQLFRLQPGVMLNLLNLTLADGLALGTNGAAGVDGGPGQGGAVYNNGGTVNALNCSFLRNAAKGGNGGSGDGFTTFNGNGGVGSGGVVYNAAGFLNATGCVFALNSALGGAGAVGSTLQMLSVGGDARGGAVYSQGGTIQLVNCVASNNTTTGGLGYRRTTPGVWQGGTASGGAVYKAAGEASIVGCTLAGNSSVSGTFCSGYGGAIYQSGGNLHVVTSLLGYNWVFGGKGVADAVGTPMSAAPAFGGAVFASSGSVWITNSTLAGNFALGGPGYSYGQVGSAFGGGVYSSGTLQAANSTLSGNIARTGMPGGSSANMPNAWGGGLCNSGGTANLNYVTFSGNSAEQTPGGAAGTGSTLGGGIYTTNATPTLHCIIVANSPSGSNSFGALVDGGYNLGSDASCNFNNTGSLNNTDPKLAPLDYYDGPTPTLALLAGSPAMNAGDSTSYLSTDQRGRARPFGSAPDIGAFESSPPYTIHGTVSGATFRQEVSLTAGSSTSSSTNHGSYGLLGLAAGTWSVIPKSPYYLFLPASQSVTVGPDQIGVNFKAYHWHEMSLDDFTTSFMHVIFAGTNGQSYRLLASPNFNQWSPVLTNTIDSSRYLEFFLPVGPAPAQFYRMITP